MTKEEYKQQFTEDDAVGWLSIDYGLTNLYYDEDSVGEEFSNCGFEFNAKFGQVCF